MLNKNVKKILILVFVFALVTSGLTIRMPVPLQAQELQNDPELTTLKENLETNGLMYVSDANTFPSLETTNFNKQNLNIKIAKLPTKDINQLDFNKFKNIAITTDQLANKETLSKILEAYNHGARIILRKDKITDSEAYKFLGVEMPSFLAGATQTNSKLTTVAISIFKDSSGIDHVTNLNVETNNLSEVLRVMIVASRDDKATFKSKTPITVSDSSIIQTAKADASISTSWPRVGILSNQDQWDTVNVGWTFAVYKDPTNPGSDGSYVCMADSVLTVTPRGNNLSGAVYIYHNTNVTGGKVSFYAPPPLTNQPSFGINPFGASPASSLTVYFNNAMNCQIAGGNGANYTQWTFYPVQLGGIITYLSTQTYYEGTDQYYQYGSSFNVGDRYTVKMYEYNSLYATATSSHQITGS